MYLWRNMQEGQLTAVLRWLQARRESRRGGAPAAPGEARPLAAEAIAKPVPPAAR